MTISSSSPSILPTLRRNAAKAMAALSLALASALPASAQVSEQVDSSLLETWRLNTGNAIRFCQYDSAPTFDFDRAVAEEISQRLLVASEYEVLGASYGIGGEFAAEDLFVSLTNDCDVMLGMGIAANLYPTEFITSRPYVGFSYVLAVADPSIEGLGGIPGGERVGAQVGSYGFRTLVRYAATLPQDRRIIALPYADTELMTTRLLDGSIAGMIVYGPSLVDHQRQAGEAELYLRQLDAQLVANVEIGGLLLSSNAYLRTLIDQAIADMINDGTIDALVEETGFASIPYAAGGNQ